MKKSLKMKILVLGANGMLGNAFVKIIQKYKEYEVFGTIRTKKDFNNFVNIKIYENIDCENFSLLESLLMQIKPEVVVNCVGLVKQNKKSNDLSQTILINSLLPHKLYDICQKINARLIQISTDCVFSGKLGFYSEIDDTDPQDTYGRSKLLGEINNISAITLRTSIIGHSLSSQHGLLDWFLSQKDNIKGYRKAIFSGLSTYELSKVIIELVIPNFSLKGIYHVSSEPISKFDLLSLVRSVYKKSIDIIPDDSLVIDRSLNSQTFKQITKYKPPQWERMIEDMYKFF